MNVLFEEFIGEFIKKSFYQAISCLMGLNLTL